MILSLHEPLATDPVVHALAAGLDRPLGALLPPAGVLACRINGRFRADWAEYVPGPHDRVDCYVAGPGDLTGGQITFILIQLLLSVALTVTATLLAPKPRQAPLTQSGHSRPQEAFGIAGLTNTLAPGTPKFVVFGERRVFGHLIATSVDLAANGKDLAFGALYLMGRSSGRGYESLAAVEINDIPVIDLPEVSTETRLGTLAQTVISGFEEVTQVFFDGRNLPYTTALIYTTQGTTISRAKVFVEYPGGLRKVDPVSGADLAGKSQIRLERKKPADVGWTLVSETTVEQLSLAKLYRQIDVSFPSVDQWQLRVTEIHDKNSTAPPTVTQDAVLYNVEEIQAATRAYPGHALLAIRGVASAQLQSLENMRVSGLVKGEKVKVWTGSAFVEQWSQQRAWICRCLLTDPVLGLGHRIPEALHDDAAALTEQPYWDELVPAQGGGTEARDRCDVVINERRPGWDWLKDLLGEGRASYLPSAGKFKLVIDRPRTANLLWSEPGNILDDSVEPEFGYEGKSINTVRGQFPDGARHEKTALVEVKSATIGSDPVRDEGFVFLSLTRQSNVIRMLQYQLKRRTLIRRRWSWKAAPGALVSEPLDVDRLSYRTVDDVRGQSGFVAAAVGAAELALNRPVVLEAASTYEAVLLKKDHTVQTRTVTTPPGTWGRLTVSSAFSPVPAEGDLWAVGKQGVHIVPVQIVRVKPIEGGPVPSVFQVGAQEYQPAIYDVDALPDPSQVRFLASDTVAPIPLADAQVREQVISNADGSWASSLYFDVTPGLTKQAGNAQGGAAGYIDLATTESALDDFFNEASIALVGGAGAGQTRVASDYTGSSKRLVPDSNWTTAPTSSSKYEISRLRYAPLGGFIVEEGLTAGGPWSKVAEFSGTTGKLPGAGVARTTYFRFTPLSDARLPNLLARISRTIAIAGDTSAPAAPTTVGITAAGVGVSVDITMARPTAVDLAGWEVELWKTAISSGTLLGTFKVSAPGQDDAGSGSMVVRQVFNLSGQVTGDVIYARARSVDGSNNQSGWTNSSGVTITGTAITTEQRVTGPVDIGTSQTDILTKSVTIAGSKALVQGRVRVHEGSGGLGVFTMLRLKRDTTLLDELQVPVVAAGGITVPLIDIDAPGPGTYTYKLTGQSSSGGILHSDAGLWVSEYA